MASCADLIDGHVIDETDDLSALAAGRAAGGAYSNAGPIPRCLVRLSPEI